MKPDLSVEIAGIRMQNPVMNAAGTFGLEEYEDLIDISRLGAYVHKSITLNLREGNPQPRIYEVAAGMINRIGLQNIGVQEFVDKKLPIIYRLLPSNVPLIVSVAGESIEGYLKTASTLEEKSNEMIAALEINVSCPNVKDGLIFGSDPDLLFELVRTLRSKVTLLLIVKLTPNVTDIGLVVKAAVDGGADAISLINTVKAKARIRGYWKGGSYKGLCAGQWIEGGLSGPAIKPIALKKVEEVVEVVEVPIIGMGGISDLEDALDFLRIGATAVAVGTATFRNPSAMIDIIDGLEQYLIERGYANIAELKEKEGSRDLEAR